MRTALPLLAAIAALPGCLSTPDGQPQSWPPALGDDVELEVAAIAAGQIDDDAIDDLVVVAIADGEGLVLLLRGGVDLAPDADAPIASFSRVASLGAIDPPVEALVVDLDPGSTTRSVVVSYLADDEPRLTLLGPDLTISATHDLTLPPQGATIDATLSVAPLGGGGERLFLSLGSQIRHAAVDELDDDDPAFQPLMTPIEDPELGTWPPVRLIAPTPGDDTLVVAGERDAWAAPPPAMPDDWYRLRQGSTQAWDPVVVISTGLDAALIGRAPNGDDPDQLCGVPTDASVAASCTELGGGDQPGRPTLLPAQVFGSAAIDLISIISGGADTRAAVIPDVDLVGGQLEAGDILFPLGPTDVRNGLAAIGDFGGSQDRELIIVGDDGDAACLSLAEPLLERCEP